MFKGKYAKVVSRDFQSFIGELYQDATEDEKSEIKSMITLLYQMYVVD